MAASAELYFVKPADVASYWPPVAHLIRRAIERGGMYWENTQAAFEYVEHDLMNERALLWLVVEGRSLSAATVTHVSEDRGHRVCTIVACGGHGWERWGKRMMDGLENYARAQNCKRMEICGRPGWRRRLPDYRVKKVLIGKSL